MVIVHLSNKQRRIMTPEKGETLNNLFKRFCLEFGYSESDYEFGSYPEDDHVPLDMAINANRVKEVLLLSRGELLRRPSSDSCYATISDDLFPVYAPNQQQRIKVVAPKIPQAAPPVPPTARPIVKRSAPRPPVTTDSGRNSGGSQGGHSPPQQPPDIDIPPPPEFLPSETERCASLHKSIDCGTDDSIDRRWSYSIGYTAKPLNYGDESNKDGANSASASLGSIHTYSTDSDGDIREYEERLKLINDDLGIPNADIQSHRSSNGGPVLETSTHQQLYQQQQPSEQFENPNQKLQEELLKQREIEQQNQREIEKQKQREIEQQRQREMEQQKQREIEQQKQREIEQQRQREMEQQRQREIEQQKQREIEQQRQREIEQQKQREIEQQRQREIEQQKQREIEQQKQREIEQQKQREIEQQEEQRTQQEEQQKQQDQQQWPQQKRQSLPMCFSADNSNSSATKKRNPKIFNSSAATVDFLDEEDISMEPPLPTTMAPPTAAPVTTSTVPRQQPRQWWELPKQGKTMQFLTRTFQTDENDVLNTTEVERTNTEPSEVPATEAATEPAVQVTVTELPVEQPESDRPTYRPRQGKQLYFTATRSK